MNSSASPEAAAEKLLRRRAAREGLIAFTEYTMPRYHAAGVHHKIAEQLERVERGEIDRLQLLVPPRHGKSELASRHFPAYYLGHHPERQLISASASAALASDFGRDVRNIINSREYKSLFATRLAQDSQAKDRWHTNEGGSYYAVGVGSDIMGRGAHVFIIDDPFGNMAEARSELERKNVWQWYQGSCYNRLENGGAIILINHRMHEDDLSGMLLQQQAAGGDAWEVVELKALSDNDEALWPEKYPPAALHRIRANTAARDWSSLFQQNPTPDDGDYFSSDWLKPYTEVPDRKTLQVYGASDYAVTSNGGDYTVHVVVGLDPDDRMYLLDLWRGRAASDVWVEALADLINDWRPIGWAEESGQITSGIGPYLARRLIERKAYIARKTFAARGDKSIRAQSIRGRMAMKGLYVPFNAPWYPDFRSELLAFPAGRHDDAVDAMGLIGQIIDLMGRGQAPEVPAKPKILSTDPAINNITMDDLWDAHDHSRKRTARVR